MVNWFIVVIDSPRLPQGLSFKINPGSPPFVIGREKASQKYHIRLPEMNISRSHAFIFCQVDNQADSVQPYVQDHGSLIGTFVNDIKISESREKSPPIPLSHQDIIKIGETSFQVINYDLCQQHTKDSKLYPNSNRNDIDDLEDDIEYTSYDESLSSSYYSNVKRLFSLSRMNDSNTECKYSSEDSFGTKPVAQHTISESNVGFKMLKKLGWESGQGLGRNQQGSPIPIQVKPFTSRPSFSR